MEPTFDDRAEWFDAHYASTRGRIRRDLLLERLDARLPPPPARLLDAGGGSGAIAVPLAERGYEVTLLDPSGGMLDVARRSAETVGVDLTFIEGGIEDAPSLAPGPYDAICCHAVLMYVDDVSGSLATFRSMAAPGAVLSLLEKNREGSALRPGLKGDYEEALRALDDPMATGNLGIENRARSIDEWRELLTAANWRIDSTAGIRLFSDLAEDDLTPERYEQLLRLEREAGRRDSYRSVSRLLHLIAIAT